MIANALSFRDRCLRSLAIALIVSVIAPSAYAYPPAYDGVLDPSFGASGAGFTVIDFGTGLDGHQDGAHRLLRQPDGKLSRSAVLIMALAIKASASRAYSTTVRSIHRSEILQVRADSSYPSCPVSTSLGTALR